VVYTFFLVWIFKNSDMKKPIFWTLAATLAVTLAATLSMTACIADGTQRPDENSGNEGVPVLIAFNPAVDGLPTEKTRAGYHDPGELLSTANGVAADRTVEHIRVMLFRASTGQLVDRFDCAIPTDGQAIEIEVLTGRYDVVFIANETSDPSDTGDRFLTHFLADERNYYLLTNVKDAIIHSAAFDDANPIPMFCISEGVDIKGQGHIVADREYTDTGTDPWSPILTRAGIRVSIELTLTPWQFDDWAAVGTGAALHKDISIAGVPVASWLAPFGRYNDSPREATARVYSAKAAADSSDPQPVAGADGYWWKEEGATDAADAYIVRFDRVILPELLFAPRNDATKAMTLAITLGTTTMTGKICCANPETSVEGYTLSRNTWLHLDARVAGSKLVVSPEVIEWNTATLDPEVVVIKYRIEVEEPVVLSGEPESYTTTVSTNIPGVTDFTVVTDGATVKAKDDDGNPVDWITSVALSGGVSATTIDGKAGITRQLEITVDENHGSPRTALIEIKAGSVTGRIEVVQKRWMIST
jgi:hypothetical protein